MRTLQRYDLPAGGNVSIQMPALTLVLSVIGRSDALELWANVDADQPLEPRGFRVLGEVATIGEACRAFIGTVVTHGGAYAWHVFEVG